MPDIFDTIGSPPGTDSGGDIFDQIEKKKSARQPSSLSPVMDWSGAIPDSVKTPSPEKPPAQFPQVVQFQQELSDKGEAMQQQDTQIPSAVKLPMEFADWTGSLIQAAGRDLASGLPPAGWSRGPGGNIHAVLQGEEQPADKFIAEHAKYAPNLAVAANVSGDLVKMAPLMAMGALPAWANRLIAAGFSVDMIRSAGPMAQQLGEELGKPEDQQDAGKIAQLKSGLIQATIFAPLAGAGAAHGIDAYSIRGLIPERSVKPVTPEVRAQRVQIADETLKKMGKPYTLLEGEIPGHSRRVAHVLDDGSIQVSIPKLHEYLETYLREGVKPEDAIHNAIEHEVIHNIFKAMPEWEKVATDYWNDFSALEKNILKRVIPQSDTLSDRVLGEESIRFFTQRAMHGSPSELLADWRKAGIGKKTMARLLDVIGFMRRNLGRTEASARQIELLNKMRDNVSEALALAEKGKEAVKEVKEEKKVAEQEVQKPKEVTEPPKAPPTAPTGEAPKGRVPKGMATKPPAGLTAGGPAAKPKIRTPSKEVKGPASQELASHAAMLAKKGMRNATPEDMKKLRNLREKADTEDLLSASALDMEKEKFIKDRIAAGINDEHIRFSVFPKQSFEHPERGTVTIPGFVQADEIHPKLGNTFSSNPDQLKSLGMNVPSSEELLKLPQGQYTLSQARKILEVGTPLEMEKTPWEQSAEDYHKLSAELDRLKALGDKASDKDFRRVYSERSKVIHQLRALDLAKAREMDDTLSRMVREGSGFNRQSIEEMSAYILSLKPEEREGALNAFDAWQVEEQAKKEKKLQEFQDAAASGKLKPIQELVGPDTVADLKIGARNYLRLGIKPITVKAGKKKGEALERQTAEQALASKSGAVVGEDRRIRYDVPTFDDWASMLSERFGVKTGVQKEHLRPIWNEVVQDFLHGLSGLKLEHFRRAFKIKGSMGRLSDANTDSIIWDIQKKPGEYPKDFYRAALSLNVDLTKPGWEEKVMKYLLEKKARGDAELDRRLHPEKYPASVRKEGKISFVSGHEPLAREEMLKAIEDYGKEQAAAQSRRAKVINELHRVMVESGNVGARSPLRSTITRGDIDFESHAKGGPGAYAIFNPQQGKNLDLLETMLSDHAAGTAKQTNRLVVLVNDKTSDANLVSVYRTYPDRKLMVYNPRGKPGDKTKNHIPLEQALKINTVKASVLLRDPVHHFHQRWVSRGMATGELRYQQEIGFDAEGQSGGGKAWKDLNVLERRKKIEEARRIHEERFELTKQEKRLLKNLLTQIQKDPASISEGDKRRLLALQRMQERLETKKVEDVTETKPEEEPKEFTPRQMKEMGANIQMLGHLAEFSETVDPDVIESKLSDPGFDPSEIESLPSDMQRALYDRGLLKQIFRNTFLQDPLSAVEAENLVHVFNDYNITSPTDITQVLADMRKLSEDIDPSTGLPRGLEGKYFCLASALDKITLQHYLEMKNNPGRREDYHNWCAENQVSPGPKAQVGYHHQLKRDALDFALNEIYDIAQSAKRTEKFTGVLPYSVDAAKKSLLELYGDRARQHIEQAAAQKKSEVERPDAIRRITEQIYGREATVSQRPSGEPGGEWKIELGKPLGGAAGVIRGVELPEGRKVAAGPMPEKVPGKPEPSKMLTPEESAHIIEELWKTKRNYGYVPSTPQFHKPLMTPKGAEGEMVRGVGLVPPKTPFIPWEDRPSVKEWWETGEGNPALEMEQEATREPMTEGEWGPSRRAWLEMQQQGRRGEYPEKQESLSIEQMRKEGEQIVQSGEMGDPETMRYNVERGEGINTARASAMIYWGKEYEAYANRIGKEYGYKSKEYDEAFKMSEDWHKFLVENIGRTSSEVMNMLRGNQDIDMGSITFVRRAAQAAAKKRGKRTGGRGELSPEEEAIGDHLANEVADAENDLTVAVEAQGEALTKAPIPEAQTKSVEAVIREMERRRAADRIEWEKRHPKSPEMAMEGPQGPRDLSKEDFDILVRQGGYLMFDLSKKGELSDATWREAMLKEFPEAAGHLDEIFPQSTKFRDDFISHTIGATAATAEARKILSQVKSTPEYSLSVIRRAVEMDPKGKRISAPEAKHIWNIFKNKFLVADKDGIRPSFEEAIWKMSDWVKAESDKLPIEKRWALPPDRIMRALASNKSTKRTTKEMYEKSVAHRRALTTAKNWLKNLEYPGWIQKTRKIPRIFFGVKIFGHGFVGMVTHAGPVAFNPWQWKNYAQAWKDMYKMAPPTKSAELANMKYMRMITSHDRFRHWLKAGLQIDPFKYIDDYQINDRSEFIRRFTSGRGFDALKGLRLTMAEQWWNRLPEKLRTDDMARMISKSVNHSTGIVTTPIPEPWGEYASWAMFAPKLEMSRWAWLLKDPAQATSIYARYLTGRKVSPEEMSWAKYELTQKAIVIGCYFAALSANQGLLMAARLTGHGNDQDVNFTDPKKPDWLSFKVAGFKVGIVSPMIGLVRFLTDLTRIGWDSKEDQTPIERIESSPDRTGARMFKYGVGKLSPVASFAAENWFGQEPYRRGRPMPWSDKDIIGVDKYSYPEYLLTRGTPIPIEETLQEAWKGIGMDESTIKKYLRAIAVAATAMATGARVASEE